MECKDLTFDKLPEAVAYLIEAVAEIKSLVKNKTELPEKRIPIGIEDACRIIQKAKPTIYALVRKGLLPSYKRGKKLFFFEEELLEWIAKGKKKTILDIRAEMEADLYSKSKRRWIYLICRKTSGDLMNKKALAEMKHVYISFFYTWPIVHTSLDGLNMQIKRWLQMQIFLSKF